MSYMDDTDTIVNALDIGGDDYLKAVRQQGPFREDPRRVAAKCRKRNWAAVFQAGMSRFFGGCKDTGTSQRKITYVLLHTEFRILSFLMSHRYLKSTWGKGYYFDKEGR